MSRILVVEPQKILQQAIVLFLFPDHEVEVNENLAEKEIPLVKDFDLAIIDAAALREVNTRGAQWSRTLQGWKIPTIWIEDASGAQAPSGNQFVVLGRPMEREALRAAITKCLGVSSTSKRNGPTSSSATDKTDLLGMTRVTDTADAPQVKGSPIIDLVDVVEEEPERKKNQRQQRNAK
jgi:hypothetical protein